MIRRLHEEGAGAVLMHVCGDIRPIIGDLVATGLDVLDLDTPVPLDEARTLAGPTTGLRGNLNPTSLFRAGPADAAAMARDAILASGGRRFLLGTGCEVAAGTPIENVAAMVDAARDAGPRPGDAAG